MLSGYVYWDSLFFVVVFNFIVFKFWFVVCCDIRCFVKGIILSGCLDKGCYVIGNIFKW